MIFWQRLTFYAWYTRKVNTMTYHRSGLKGHNSSRHGGMVG